MPEEAPTFVEPKTEAITLKASLKGDFNAIATRLADIQTISIEADSEKIEILRIERRDIQNRPYLFMILELKKDALNINYTIATDSGPKLRRLAVIKDTLGILSLITDIYTVDNSELFQYMDSSIDELTGSLSQSYSALFNSYDSIFNEYKELKRMNIELAASNKNLSVQASQLSEDNKKLEGRVKQLEVYSNESLMVMIEEWLESHSNEIDISDFSKTYKLSSTRVDEMLNKMVSLGYIALKG